MVLLPLSSTNPAPPKDDVIASLESEGSSTFNDCLEDITDEFSSEIADNSVKLLNTETGRLDATL